MGKLSALLWGTAIGAGMMYFNDPQNGKRRKAMVHDRVYRLQNQANEAVNMGVNDLRNRARGLMAEGQAILGDEKASDQVIVERVRSRLGFLSRHPGAIHVTALDHRVVLEGDVLADEVDSMLAAVAHIRGVDGIDNRLHVHQEAGNIPTLQGTGWLPSDTPGQWAPSTRLLATGGALYLFLYGMFRGGLIGTLAQMSGAVLGTRAMTNLDLQRMLGLRQEGAASEGSVRALGAVRVRKTIQIEAPVDRVYKLWSDFENFPKFMNNVESIKNVGGNKSHWVVKGPAGSKVEFDAIVTEERPDEVIAWETTPDSTVRHSGQVRFMDSGQRGTQVSVNMAYTPPAGIAGAAVAALFGKDPKSEMDEDLARMKSLIEVGKTRAGNKEVTHDQVMPVTGGTSDEILHSETQDKASPNEDTYFPPENQ